MYMSWVGQGTQGVREANDAFEIDHLFGQTQQKQNPANTGKTIIRYFVVICNHIYIIVHNIV